MCCSDLLLRNQDAGKDIPSGVQEAKVHALLRMYFTCMHVSHLCTYHKPTCITNRRPRSLGQNMAKISRKYSESGGIFQVGKHFVWLKLYAIRVGSGDNACNTLSQDEISI
jgi:hypothetical protein